MLACIIAFKLVDLVGRKLLIIFGTTIALLATVLVFVFGGRGYLVLTAGILSI